MGDPVAQALAAVPRIGAAEASRLVAEEGALLVDVRESGELERTGKLAGAFHVPRAQVELGALDQTPGRAVILYCAAGVRSALAGKALVERGRTQVFNLGGFAEIAAAGWPVEPA